MNPLKKLRRWVWNVLYATDEWINAATGGDPQHTISLRAARAAAYGTGYKRLAGRAMCRFLDLFDPGHCVACLEDIADGGRA